MYSGVTNVHSFRNRTKMVCTRIFVDHDGVSLSEGFSSQFRRKVFDAFSEAYDKLYIRHKNSVCFNMVDAEKTSYGRMKNGMPVKTIFCGRTKEDPDDEMCFICRSTKSVPLLWSKK